MQFPQCEADVPQAVCPENAYDTTNVEVRSIVRPLRAGAGIAVLAANAWLTIRASTSLPAEFGEIPFLGGRRIARRWLIVGLMA